jgi:hypothetical protein
MLTSINPLLNVQNFENQPYSALSFKSLFVYQFLFNERLKLSSDCIKPTVYAVIKPISCDSILSWGFIIPLRDLAEFLMDLIVHRTQMHFQHCLLLPRGISHKSDFR